MAVESALIEVLTDAQRLGFLGARPIDEVVEHARRFVVALDDVPAGAVVLDLGSGGGIPGLVIAHDRPDLHCVLVDRRTKRTDAVQRAVRRLGWSERVTVRAVEAHTLVRDEPASVDVVVARGFGPPESTLSIASALCRSTGRIVISEPPDGDRWTTEVLDAARVERWDGPGGVAVFRPRRFT